MVFGLRLSAGAVQQFAGQDTTDMSSSQDTNLTAALAKWPIHPVYFRNGMHLLRNRRHAKSDFRHFRGSEGPLLLTDVLEVLLGIGQSHTLDRLLPGCVTRLGLELLH